MGKFDEFKNMFESSKVYKDLLQNEDVNSFKNIAKEVQKNILKNREKNSNLKNNKSKKDTNLNKNQNNNNEELEDDNYDKSQYLKDKIEAQRSIIKNNDNTSLANINHFRKIEEEIDINIKEIAEDMSPIELKKAIIYSEIIGPPKCKSRRRDRRRYGL